MALMRRIEWCKLCKHKTKTDQAFLQIYFFLKTLLLEINTLYPP